MKKFLDRPPSRSRTPQRPQIEAPASAYNPAVLQASMAASEATQDHHISHQGPPGHAGEVGEMDTLPAHPLNPAFEGGDTERIARAVAALLTPTIQATVEKAISNSMAHFQRELHEHSLRLDEVENRVASVEDDVYQLQSLEQSQDKSMRLIIQKLEDLENRSRRNNLRFIGVPESLQNHLIMEFCARRVPEALGLSAPMTVERAHRLGQLDPQKSSPRPIIARYLNYADKVSILQKFRQQRHLLIDGVKLLIFADYSAEVSKQRKAFQPVCAQLFQQHIKFTLAFPAILRLKSPNGEQLTFHDPAEADLFLRSLKPAPGSNHVASSTSAQAQLRPPDQRSPRKDSPKRPKFSDPSIPLPPR